MGKRGPAPARSRASLITFFSAFSAAVVAGCPSSTQRALDSAPSTATATPAAIEVAEAIYDGGLRGSWQALGSAPRETSGGGPAKVRFDGYGEWILAKPGLTGDFGGVVFREKVDPTEGEFLEIGVRSSASPTAGQAFVKIEPDDRRALDDGWVEVAVSMDRLDPERRPFDRVVFRAFRPFGADWVLLDKVSLAKPGAIRDVGRAARVAAATPPRAGANGVRSPMRIACDAPATKISPYIYGVGYVDADHAPSDVGATIHRWGGNRSTRYNWELHADNSASDWYFENHPAEDWAQFIASDRAHGKATALTVPIIGWVAKDTSSYSFPVSELGPQGRADPYHPDAGDGTTRSGGAIAPGPPTRTSVPAPPEWIKRWIVAIRANDAKTGERGVAEYILDNEPMTWSKTHRDVHPDPVGYDELLDRTIRYGTAIREADPDAVIAGPAVWGWSAYFYSGKDLAPGALFKPDRRAHGGVPLIEWYLRKLREHDQKTGKRILDVLDVHFYPQGAGVYGDDTDTKTALLRLRATRSLWDPTYVDESWIDDTVRLLPRMREWIDRDDPGLGISIGEWNFGGERHVTGALATAEALGRFAQFGVTSAFYWSVPPAGSPSVQGFLAYRDFDGKGGQFLDWYVPTTSKPGVSLFASRDAEGKRVVAVAINMSADETQLAQIDASSCGTVTSHRAYVYTSASPSFVAGAPVQDEATAFDQALPPWSITVLDVQLARPMPRGTGQ